MFKNAKNVSLIVAAILLIIFVLQNTKSVEIQFLFFTLGMPAAVMYFVLLVAGFAIGVYVGQRIRGRQTGA